MTTASVKVGDIVEVDKNGRWFFALVTRERTPAQALTQGGKFAIKPITSGITYRSCTAREVVGHYRRTKASRVPFGVPL